MATRRQTCAAVLACVTVLAGCASSHSADPSRSGAAPAGDARMTPGMVMPDGSTMGASAGAARPSAGGPSAAAQMICSAELRADLATATGLRVPAATAPRWSGHVYSCTYRLPMGTLALSVTESADEAAAKAHAAALRRQLEGPRSLDGLTEVAFGTPTGVVALVKDSDTLQVDATALPARFGSQQQKRADFAYEVASIVLGCWTGDDE